MKTVYSDLRTVARIMSGHGAVQKFNGAAPAVDRSVRWVKEAKFQSALEMLNFGLSNGKFTPAVRDEQVEQCVEVMVGELGFKVPEVPQQSASANRVSEKRAREKNDENEDEEQADADLFEDAEEDEELKRRMDAFFMAKVPGYAPAAGEGEASVFALREMPCAKLRKQIVADPVSGEMKSGAVPRLPKNQFRAQNMKMVESFDDEKEWKHFVNYISWIVSLDYRYTWADLYDFATRLARGCQKGKDCGFIQACRNSKFMAIITAVGVSLASYRVPKAEHQQYMRDAEAVGAVVSPLTERADRWAQAAWGLPGAEAVVQGVATGFAWQRAEPAEFFQVENYVPPQHEEKVALKLQEEEDAGRMVRTDAGSVPGISALGIVLRVVDGKVKERIVHELSRPKRGFPRVVVYLDDFILIANMEEACQQGFEVLIELVEYLGFEVAPEKVESPQQDMVFLQSNQSGLRIVAMSIDEYRAMMWLAKMLEAYNGQAVVLNRRPVVRDFFAVDAAGEEAVDGGMGGFFGGRWFAVKWEEVKQWKRGAPKDLDDWMIKDWLWDKVRVLGPFAVDACRDEVGANSRCFRCSKEDSCLLRQWRGLNVYCNPPFSLLFEILTHFLKEKRAAPNTTSAVFNLPFWPTERFWLELVVPAIDAGLFVVLEYIPEDSDVFTSPNGVRGLRKGCGFTRWPVVLVACPVTGPKGKAWKRIGQKLTEEGGKGQCTVCSA
ncbi:hypothetical protein CYMTET_3769 [Cymbomonas tetramitiformis]|uniref:Reverse transcriptase domain-containing protein n=1 Tax=Cymbomonas tetramitiformis TaxID=36881 RepID=A0AAE0LKQ5_9CHLO|nr:hypothetical protein CYMTET_3769 [Cymbomonas tetramitiformis]